MRSLVVVAAVVAAAAPASAQDAPPTKEALAANRVACERAAADCDPVMLLSRLERRAVDRVLAAHPELALDHAPAGKTIAAVRIVNQDVFGPGDGFLQWFNFLHVTTRQRAVRRELTLGEGDAWDQLRLDESARRLRDPVSTGLVAIVPLIAADGTVEMLIVTRDVWSLRANSLWEIQEQQLTYLSVSLSENNLLGRRKLLALSFRMDQGAFFVGPVYIDKNIAGAHVDLRARGGPLFNRYTQELEGSESVFELARPIFSVDERWGAGLAWSHRYALDRSFLGAGLRTYDAPETAEDDALPYAYRMKKLSLALSGVRGFGDDRVQQRARAGYELAVQRPTLLDDFSADPVLREAFTRDVLPRSERTSQVFAGYELFEPRYRNTPNVSTFELAEETRMGVSAEAKVGVAPKFLGSESAFVRLTGSAGYAGALGDDGLWSVTGQGTTRLERGKAIDTTVEGTVRVVTPTIGAFGRVVTQVRAAGLFRDSQNQFYTLGGDNGLRGFPIGFFDGDRRVVWNTELRTRPIPILFTRWGAVAFYDVGGAANSYRSMKPHHDAGVGLRVLTPQINTDVFRLDFAFALDGDHVGGLRFSAGYDQTF